MYDNNENNNEMNLEQNAPQENQTPEQPQPNQVPPPPPSPYGGYNQFGGQYRTNYEEQNEYRQQNGYNWNLNDYGSYSNRPRKPRNKNGLKIVATVLCCVLFICSIAFGIAGLNALVADVDTTTSDSVAETSSTTIKAPELVINNKPTNVSGNVDNTSTLSGERVYEKVSPSVVGIVVYSSGTDTTASGEGSGVIISSDGYIVTNEHVIEDAKLIEVVLNNNERYTAKLMGYDKQTDLAVIKIDAQNLVKAELGNSDELKPGEIVYAIGNPGGIEFANSITNGIVSGVDRLITNSSTGYVMTCIQTNAAINPGNSGGALVDSYGRVVGISVAKLANVSYEGMGFAIPISDSVDLIDDLIEYGYIKGRPLLGITYYAISSEVAKFYGIPAGLKVQGVDPESDAYKKGLLPGDMITEINGQSVESTAEVFAIMSNCKAGDTMKLTVYRKGYTTEMSVVLGENDGRDDTSNYITEEGDSSGNNQNNNGNYDNNGGNYGDYGGGFFEDPFGFFPFG